MTDLTDRFNSAFVAAFNLHRDQKRKGTSTPYMAHLASVAALVLEMGGSEDEAIAALLHDAVEDQGGMDTHAMIRSAFGSNVAQIVLECSDSFSDPKPPWKERKEKYLEHLAGASKSVKLVSLADKLHNSKSILNDLLLDGDETWSKFNGGRDGTLWYYSELAKIFRTIDRNQYVVEFIELVKRIKSFK